MRADASKEGHVLRFVGVVDVDKGKVSAGLEKWVLLSIVLLGAF
jgi:hypothetical protein